jgi:hypothetical protein
MKLGIGDLYKKLSSKFTFDPNQLNINPTLHKAEIRRIHIPQNGSLHQKIKGRGGRRDGEGVRE